MLVSRERELDGLDAGIRVAPAVLSPQLFGLPDSAAMIFSLEAGRAVAPESQYRDDDRRLSATLRINGMQTELDDEKAHVTLVANSVEASLASAPTSQAFARELIRKHDLQDDPASTEGWPTAYRDVRLW